MNTLDIVLVVPLAFGLIQGFRHGLVKEVGSLVGIVTGIYLARFWSDPVAHLIAKQFDWSLAICMTIAYALVFIAGALGIQFLAHILSKLLEVIKVGWLNRTIGSIFGLLKYVLILSVVLNLLSMLNSFQPFVQKKAVQESVLYRPIEQVMPTVIPFLNFDQFTKYFNA